MMTPQPTALSDGHQLADNGVGDYDLHCPSGGARFVPYMLALMIPRLGTRCPCCGLHLQAVSPAAPPQPGDG